MAQGFGVIGPVGDPVMVIHGGTGARTAAQARANLGLAEGGGEGPQGPPGPQGPQGPAGAQGSPGADLSAEVAALTARVAALEAAAGGG